MSGHPEIRTPADFIAWEATQETKHEFAGGQISPFPGGTKAHAALALRIGARLVAHLSETPYLVFVSDMLTVTRGSVRYPDVVVTCDGRDTRDMTERSVQHPKLIVEVLSKSTAGVDRRNKLNEYRTIETLEEYVLVDSRRRWVKSFRRAADGWITTIPVFAGGLELVSVGLTLDLDELYNRAGVPGPKSSARE